MAMWVVVFWRNAVESNYFDINYVSSWMRSKEEFYDNNELSKMCCIVDRRMGGEWSFDHMITDSYKCLDMAYDPT